LKCILSNNALIFALGVTTLVSLSHSNTPNGGTGRSSTCKDSLRGGKSLCCHASATLCDIDLEFFQAYFSFNESSFCLH